MSLEYQSVKRILIIDLSKRFGGASTRALMLAKNLAPWKVSLACIKDSPVAKAAVGLGIPVEIVGKVRTDPRIPWRIARIIRERNYQIIDTQNIQSQLWGSLAVWFSNASLVSTLNSWYKNEHAQNWRGTFYTLIELGTNWRTDQYIAVSKEVEFELLNTGINRTHVDLIQNAIDIVSDEVSSDNIETRTRLGLSSSSIICLAIGRLVWAKGFDILIESFSHVIEKIPNVFLIILGDGPLKVDLKKQTNILQLQNRIKFLGYRDRDFVLELIKASNIFVMSSRTEGTPLALLEAAMFGLPIVATQCGGIPEIVTNESEALLIPVGDVQALSDAIIKLVMNPNYACKLGEQAKLKVEQEFSPKVQADMTKHAYLKALNRRSLVLVS